MENKEPVETPLHHFPVNVGLSTGMEIAPNWTMALNEFKALAAESRRRCATRAEQACVKSVVCGVAAASTSEKI